MRRVLAALLLLAPLQARAQTLAALLGRGDAGAIVDRFVVLGRSIDLADAAQVAAAIGDTDGLKLRRSMTSAFAGYAGPHGEIVFNPDVEGRRVLLVTFPGCAPAELLAARLVPPDFRAGRRIDVALYRDEAYVGRPGTALTWHEPRPGCLASLGVAQRRQP